MVENPEETTDEDTTIVDPEIEEPVVIPSLEPVEFISTDGGEGTLSWTGVEGATYDVFVDEAEDPISLEETTMTLTDLAVGLHTAKIIAKLGEEEPIEAIVEFNVPDYIADVEKLQAASGHGSVSIYWTPVEGAVAYIIAKSTNKNAENFNAENPYKRISGSSLKSVKEPFAGYKYTDKNTGKLTYYRVYAVNKNGTKSLASQTVSDSRVEYISYDFVLKKNKKLKSHNATGKQKTKTFKKGTKLHAHAFGGGKYKFYQTIGGKQYIFYCKSIDTKSNKAFYDKKMNYSRLEAENFVNEYKFSSSTKYLVWASLYTQHVYVFTGSTGKWDCVRDFECGSGSAKLASPSGTNKKIIKGPGTDKKPGKKKNRHSRKYWSPFSGWNSFHAKRPDQKLGYPASKGCIRSELADAKYLYDKVPVLSRVVVL